MIDDQFHPLFTLDQGQLHYFSVLGRAIHVAQHFERNCTAMNSHFDVIKGPLQYGPGFSKNEELLKTFTSLWKKSLGKQISLLREKGLIIPDFNKTFDQAVESRNILAHEITRSISNETNDFEESINEIKEIVRKISSADKYISAMLQVTNKDPLPLSHFFDKYEERVVKWVTEETFEG